MSAGCCGRSCSSSRRCPARPAQRKGNFFRSCLVAAVGALWGSSVVCYSTGQPARSRPRPPHRRDDLISTLDAETKREMQLLCNAGDTGNAAGAEAVLRRVLRRVPNALRRMLINTAIKACIRHGDLPRAIRHLKEMQALRVDPSDRTFGKLMIVAKVDGNYQQMGLLFKEMLDLNIKPSTFAFNSVLSAMGRDGGLEDAERWFGRFVQEGMRPDSETYHTMIAVAANNSDLGRAEHWQQKGVRAGVEISAASYAELSRAAQLVGNASASEFWFDKGLGVERDPLARDMASMPKFRQRRLSGRESKGRSVRPPRKPAGDESATRAGFQSLANALGASLGTRAGQGF